VLERDGRGLNLTAEVRDGILHHTGRGMPSTLEGRIVRLVDRVAYINHDIDDALRAGVLAPDELPRDEIELLGDRGSRRIDTLVHDLVETSAEAGDIVQSEGGGRAMQNLRAFMFERVYLGPATEGERTTASSTVRRVFDHLVHNPDDLPPDRPGDLPERIADYVSGMTDRFALAWR
jgi:dGTPase